ncbi:hypothetical protein [Streptomyces wuyuanensis]|uniref:hypothetical protein n=1 Tax=Streptomyces wuyuanensis TaxID=1196353 RepID=UPI00378E1A02
MRPHQYSVCSAIQAVVRRVQTSRKPLAAKPVRSHSASAAAMRSAVTYRAQGMRSRSTARIAVHSG